MLTTVERGFEPKQSGSTMRMEDTESRGWDVAWDWQACPPCSWETFGTQAGGGQQPYCPVRKQFLIPTQEHPPQEVGGHRLRPGLIMSLPVPS